MITTVNTIAGLLAALKVAKGGDTVLLAPGTYDAVAINNIKFKSTVTIASADPTHQAVLSNLSLNNTAYLTFKQLTLTTSTGTAATVLSSNHVSFVQDAFSGAAVGSGNAMMVRYSDSITITGSNFGKFGTGINVLTDSNVSITNNVFHDITSGDVRGTGLTSSSITGNTFSNADSTITNHVDVINLWQDNAANHVVIDANIYGSTVAPPPATPAAPTDASVIGGYVNAAHDTVNQTINGTAGAGMSVTIYDNGTKVAKVTADSTGVWSYQVGALADGSSHSYTVTATDLAGNTSAASAALHFTVDATAPVQPGAPADASVVNGYVNAAHDTAGQAIGGTTEAGAAVAIYDNGIRVGTETANSSGVWTHQIGALADGSSHSYTVTSTDLAGNTSAASSALNFTVDATAPVQPGAPTDASVVNGSVDAAHNTATQAIVGTTEAGALVAIYDNGTKIGSVSADNTGAWAYQIGALAAGSSHSYTVTATDVAGNTSAASAALNFTVASPAPPPAPAPVVTEVSSIQQLLTALSSAHAGDVIAVDAGVYDAVSLNNFNFTSAVTITSMDSAHHAVFSNLDIEGSSGLTFDHVDLTTATGTAVTMGNSHGITFSNDTISGSATGVGNAMMLRYDDSVSITGSDVGHFGTGINVLTDSNFTIANNVFHDIAGNGIRGTDLTTSTITGNTFADAGSVPNLWQDNTANQVTITNNVTLTGTTATTSSSSTTTTTTTTTSTAPITTTSPTGAQTVTVSNTQDLWTALSNAHAGDTIKLAAGNYDLAGLYNFHFSSNVTITSADLSHQAVLNGIDAEYDSHLAFDHLTVAVNGGTGLYIGNDSDVSFSNITVQGPAGTISGLGAMVRASTNVSITNSEFSWLGQGIGHLDANGLTVSNNSFHDINVDGVSGGGSANVVVSGNTFTNFHPGIGDHPDAIQFYGDSYGNQSSNILVKDNVISRGTGDAFQGIFIENTNHIEITGNAMAGTMTNGISLSAVTEGLVTNNFLDGWTDYGSRIITRGGSVDVTVGGNTADSVQNYNGSGVNVNYVDAGNTIVADSSVGDISTMTAWLATHALSTASLSDAFFLH